LDIHDKSGSQKDRHSDDRTLSRNPNKLIKQNNSIMSQLTSIANEVTELVKLKEKGKLSEAEFLRARRDLIERNTHYLKRSIGEMLNELWR
jgi:hypothetical protein